MTPPSPCGWTRSTPASCRCSTISPRRCRASSHSPAASRVRPSAEPSRTAFIAMHPMGSPGYLPMFSNLARVGHHVVACATRYSNGDAALQMENVLLDLAACVRDTRERLGYERVVLVGWSGG